MKLSILGTRGIPAQHGGFETFAEKLALYLVKNKWQVSVYCQDGSAEKTQKEKWRDIELVKIPVKTSGALGTIIFDLKAIWIAKNTDSLFLTLGYNTAILCSLLKFKKKINIINMDGLEWKRRKYNQLEKLWLYINERLGIIFSDHVIADNPAIEHRIKMISPTNKSITMIPYGADKPNNKTTNNDQQKILNELGIKLSDYVLVVARPVEENNILEIVQTFSRRIRNHKLVILGNYQYSIPYQKRVLDIAGNEVLFLGAIYDKIILDILRTHAKLYIHGHSVGGTNPALVEALSAEIAVLAHDNPFNRWVAGDGSHYFLNEEELDRELTLLLSDRKEIEKMSVFSTKRFEKDFKWGKILFSYEKVFKSFIHK